MGRLSTTECTYLPTCNRLYTWAAIPPGFGAALCPLCGLAFADMPGNEAWECVPQLMSLLLQTWAVWRVSGSRLCPQPRH